MNILRRVMLLVLLMCAGCNLSQQAATNSTPTVAVIPTDAVTPTPEVSLATYSNTAYGYTVQYPEGLAVDGAADSQYVWIDHQIYILVSEINPEEPMGDAPVIDSVHDTMIGTNTARRITGYIGAVGGNTPQRYESFVIAHNNQYYQFIAYELKRDEAGAVDRTMNAVPENVVALLTQIVTSLRFTN